MKLRVGALLGAATVVAAIAASLGSTGAVAAAGWNGLQRRRFEQPHLRALRWLAERPRLISSRLP